jgi:hypothetical protein
MYRCDVGVTNSRRPPSLGAPNEKARRAKRRANNADLNFFLLGDPSMGAGLGDESL